MKVEGSASAVIEAPASRCYAVAADLERAPDWQASFENLVVVERDAEGRPSLIDAHFGALIRTVAVRLRCSYSPPTTVTCVRESGDLKTLCLTWVLRDLGGDRVRATYDYECDPGRLLSVLAKGPLVDDLRSRLANQAPLQLKAAVERGAGETPSGHSRASRPTATSRPRSRGGI